MVVCGQLDQVVGEADPLLFCYSNGLAKNIDWYLRF